MKSLTAVDTMAMLDRSAAKGDAVPHTRWKPLLPDVVELSAKKQKKVRLRKLSKKERRVQQIRQTDERTHQHNECEKRVITGHMITTRYISTCKNLCTLHSFLVRLPPNSMSLLTQIPLPTKVRSVLISNTQF